MLVDDCLWIDNKMSLAPEDFQRIQVRKFCYTCDWIISWIKSLSYHHTYISISDEFVRAEKPELYLGRSM